MDECIMGNEIDIINFLKLKTTKLNPIQKLFKREGDKNVKINDVVRQEQTDSKEQRESKELSKKKLALLNLINLSNTYDYFKKHKNEIIKKIKKKYDNISDIITDIISTYRKKLDKQQQEIIPSKPEPKTKDKGKKEEKEEEADEKEEKKIKKKSEEMIVKLEVDLAKEDEKLKNLKKNVIEELKETFLEGVKKTTSKKGKDNKKKDDSHLKVTCLKLIIQLEKKEKVDDDFLKKWGTFLGIYKDSKIADELKAEENRIQKIQKKYDDYVTQFIKKLNKKEEEKNKKEYEKKFNKNEIKSDGNCGYNSILYPILKNTTLKEKLERIVKEKGIITNFVGDSSKKSSELKKEGNVLRELIFKSIFKKDELKNIGKDITKKEYDQYLSKFIKNIYKKDENVILQLNTMKNRALHGWIQSKYNKEANISSNYWMENSEAKLLEEILDLKIYIINPKAPNILLYVNGMSKAKDNKTMDTIIKEVKENKAIVIEFNGWNHYQSRTLKEEGKPKKGGRKTLKNKHMYRKRNKTLKKIY